MTIRNKTFVDVHLNLIRDISQVFADFEYLHDSGNGKYDMVVANKTIDICEFLNNRKSNALLDIAYKILEESGELPKKCPIRMVWYERFAF